MARGTELDIVVRAFASKAGLPEDPVCGTAHRILSPFWCERFGRKCLHSRHLSPRGGNLRCEFAGTMVTIAGQTRRFLEGELLLPGA